MGCGVKYVPTVLHVLNISLLAEIMITPWTSVKQRHSIIRVAFRAAFLRQMGTIDHT